jgi:hypothetical protein
MSVGKCHVCGTEYGIAPALAGQTFTCRKCGAKNDGAGLPIPRGHASTAASTSASSSTLPSARTESPAASPPARPVLAGARPRAQPLPPPTHNRSRRAVSPFLRSRDLLKAVAIVAIVGSLSAGALLAVNAMRSHEPPAKSLPANEEGLAEDLDRGLLVEEPSRSEEPSDSGEIPESPRADAPSTSAPAEEPNPLDQRWPSLPPGLSQAEPEQPTSETLEGELTTKQQRAVDILDELRRIVADLQVSVDEKGNYPVDQWKTVAQTLLDACRLDEQLKTETQRTGGREQGFRGGFIRPLDNKKTETPAVGPVDEHPGLVNAWRQYLITLQEKGKKMRDVRGPLSSEIQARVLDAIKSTSATKSQESWLRTYLINPPGGLSNQLKLLDSPDKKQNKDKEKDKKDSDQPLDAPKDRLK